MLFRGLRDMIGQEVHYCFSDNLLCFAFALVSQRMAVISL
jgi:hypothetical protein